MFSQHITIPSIDKLHKAGLHFVRCREKDVGDKKAKSALDAGWQKRAASLADVLKHRASGGLLGFIPGRSGLWVLDVDKFPEGTANIGKVLARLGVVPLATVTTKRKNGVHLYFKKSPHDGEVGNRAWELDGFSGEIRGDNGYCIGWQLDKLADALDRLPDAAPTAHALFPKPSGRQPVAGNRNDNLNADVFKKAQQGQADFSKERDAGIAAGLTPSEVETTIRSASGAGRALTFPRKDADALEGALAALGITARYNLRSMRPEIQNGTGAWTATDDRSSADVRRVIAGKFSYQLAGGKGPAPLKFGLDSWTENLNALLHHLEVDPFLSWLETLPKWDGTKRLGNLLVHLLGAPDGPLTRWAGNYLCLGAIQRTLKPGCLLREIPILIGPQRAGKSQLLSNLLPPENPDWFSDSVCVSDPTQKRVEGMLGRVIVELSELTGFRRAELESLKAFISRRDDGATRLAYRRDPETALRRCILVGTSNDVECLPNDPSGNTRFVPIQCGEGSHVEPYLDANRVQLWGEGLALYNKGERADLPRSMMRLQAEQGEIHRRKDSMIEEAVDGITGEGPFTIKEICDCTFTDAKNVRRLADALRLAGWTKNHTRLEGKRVYLWRKE